MVYVASSKTNDPPNGSPVMVMLEIPLAKLTERNSLGLLPESPESAKLLEKAETAEPTSELLASKAASTSGSAYVKKPENDRMGLAKLMDIGPPSSNATFVPECGGNSNSFKPIPAVRIVALVNVNPGYWVVRGVESGKPSKSRVTVPAKSGERAAVASRRRKAPVNLRRRSLFSLR